MIYTRYSEEPITITAARLVPVWSVRSPGRITRLYRKPPDQIRRRGKWVKPEVEEFPVWHYKGTYQDGSPICDGKWVDASLLIADGGWSEICSVLEAFSPNDLIKFNTWNKAYTSSVSIENVFEPLKEGEVA